MKRKEKIGYTPKSFIYSLLKLGIFTVLFWGKKKDFKGIAVSVSI